MIPRGCSIEPSSQSRSISSIASLRMKPSGVLGSSERSTSGKGAVRVELAALPEMVNLGVAGLAFGGLGGDEADPACDQRVQLCLLDPVVGAAHPAQHAPSPEHALRPLERDHGDELAGVGR